MPAARFSDTETLALACVLDELVPGTPDGRLPPAGSLALHDHLARVLAGMPELRAMVVESLAALDALARRRHPGGLAGLSAGERREVLSELAASEHAVPPILAIHAYTGYYQHPEVVAALGLEPRAPHPLGYQMEPNDLSLLDPVRRRAPLFRRC